jgi:hypothetical protein
MQVNFVINKDIYKSDFICNTITSNISWHTLSESLQQYHTNISTKCLHGWLQTNTLVDITFLLCLLSSFTATATATRTHTHKLLHALHVYPAVTAVNAISKYCKEVPDMVVIISPTHAQFISLLHTLAYMFRPPRAIIRASQITKGYRVKCASMNKILEFYIYVLWTHKNCKCKKSNNI